MIFRKPGVSNNLLSPSDPNPVRTSGDMLAPGPFLLTGDHAGRAIPAALGSLGLSEADRQRHIAVDIGVEELGLALGELLGAPFVRQAFSRLVIDCNRDPARADAVPEVSDRTRVPGNLALDAGARQARIDAILEPYQRAIGEVIEARAAAGAETILVSLHSFTPVMNGLARPWQIGVLYAGGDTRFALALLERLRAEPDLLVAGNEPYRMDETDYTVPRHAYPRGLRYVELEVRQDLIDPGAPAGVEAMARILGTALRESAQV